MTTFTQGQPVVVTWLDIPYLGAVVTHDQQKDDVFVVFETAPAEAHFEVFMSADVHPATPTQISQFQRAAR